jgi:hypothetical protein
VAAAGMPDIERHESSVATDMSNTNIVDVVDGGVPGRQSCGW